MASPYASKESYHERTYHDERRAPGHIGRLNEQGLWCKVILSGKRAIGGDVTRIAHPLVPVVRATLPNGRRDRTHTVAGAPLGLSRYR